MRPFLYGFLLILAHSLFPASIVLAREFDRLEGGRLANLIREGKVEKRPRLTLGELNQLPDAFKDTRQTFLLVKTGQKNLARLLVSPALRKPPDGPGEPVPVFILERFETFEPAGSGSRVAKGAGILLFDGSQADLDAGQVVPENQGADLRFVKGAAAKGGPAIEPVGGAEIYVATSLLPTAPAASGPSSGKAVIPGDFNGRYMLFADGRWSGLLQLEVAADRQITGRFRSEANGTAYPVTGEVSLDPPNKAAFKIKFPRAEQDYEGYLWTDGKNAISGTFSMQEKTFGFAAVREGAKLGPSD